LAQATYPQYHPTYGKKTSCLPCYIPQDTAYLVFQRLGFTPVLVAKHGVRFYRTFSPVPFFCKNGGLVFCGTFRQRLFLNAAFPLGSKLLCVARTFLYLAVAMERSAVQR
jgi:hypothetical protein